MVGSLNSLVRLELHSLAFYDNVLPVRKAHILVREKLSGAFHLSLQHIARHPGRLTPHRAINECSYQKDKNFISHCVWHEKQIKLGNQQ